MNIAPGSTVGAPQGPCAERLCYNVPMRQTGTKSPKRSSKGYVIGRSSFAKISAVEGIRTTATMDADFREFERQGLSADERRKVIRRKYGKVR
jgi:hypothetical protein